MRAEDQLLFLSTRQNFLDQHKNEVIELVENHPIQWDTVYWAAEQHGVAPLLYMNLIYKNNMQLNIPPAVINQFKVHTFQQIVSQDKRAERLSNSIDFFQKYHMQVMLVKGIALENAVYDYPWYTVSKDIDIILDRKQESISAQELAEFRRHFHRSGIEFDFFHHHDINMNGAVPVDFDRVWSDAKNINIYGHNVYVMSPEDLLISICINSCRKRYFRLKSLFDIAETTHKYKDLNWDEFVVKARAYDCSAIVYTALQISDITVGCSLPGDLLRSLRIGKRRARIIDSTTRYLLDNYALSAYPFSGPKIFGRQINISLILPYISYRGYQIWRKAGEIRENRKNN